MRNILFLLCLTMAFAVTSVATEVGSIAPRLRVEKWLRNGPVSLLVPEEDPERGNKYFAVEFWGTWSPACRDAIPVLNYLQRKYRKKGLTVVGIIREDEPKVKKFLENIKTEYAIGIDEDSKTTLQYMPLDRIFPKVFLINGAREVVWKGEVIDLEGVIELVYRGGFDAEKQKRISALHKELQLAMRSSLLEDAEKIIKNILNEDPRDGLAIRAAVFVYGGNNQSEKAFAFIDERIKAVPDSMRLRLMRLELMRQYPDIDADVAAFARKTATAFSKNPEALNELAWTLMRDFPYAPGCLTVAFDAAKKALDEMPGEIDARDRAAYFTTLARAYCKAGLPEKAVEYQKEAVALLKDDEGGKEAKQLVEYYKQALELRLRIIKGK